MERFKQNNKTILKEKMKKKNTKQDINKIKIEIQRTTAKDLTKLGTMHDTYDSVINNLIKITNEIQKIKEKNALLKEI